jgi:hypothetical protein
MVVLFDWADQLQLYKNKILVGIVSYALRTQCFDIFSYNSIVLCNIFIKK